MRFQVVGLIAAGALAGCGTILPVEPGPQDIRTIYTDMNHVIGAGDGKMSAAQFAAFGKVAIDRRCDGFFNAVALGDYRAEAVQKGFRLSSDSALAFMAATNSSAESIGRAAVVLAGLDSQIANYRQFEFLRQVGDPAMTLVLDARRAFAAANPPGRVTTSVEAAQWVHDYADLCSPGTILRFVAEAVARSEAVYENGSTNFIGRASRRLVTDALPSNVDLSGLTDAEWAELWLVLTEGPNAPALVDNFGVRFPSLRMALFGGAGTDLTADGQRAKMQLDQLRSSSTAFAEATDDLSRARAANQEHANANARQVAFDNARAQNFDDDRTKTEVDRARADPVGLPNWAPTGGGMIVIRSRR